MYSTRRARHAKLLSLHFLRDHVHSIHRRENTSSLLSLFLRGLPSYGLSQPDNLAQCGATQLYCSTFYPKSTFVLLEAQISAFDVRQSRFEHDDGDGTVSCNTACAQSVWLGPVFSPTLMGPRPTPPRRSCRFRCFPSCSS